MQRKSFLPTYIYILSTKLSVVFLLVCESVAMPDSFTNNGGILESHFQRRLEGGAFWFYRSRMLTKYQTFYQDGLSAFEAYRYDFIEISFSLFSNIHLFGRVLPRHQKSELKSWWGVVPLLFGLLSALG